MKNLNKKIFFIFFFIFLLNSCKNNTESKEKKNKKKIVCTTGMISDGIIAIVGDEIEVITLMREGIDPHIYRPTPSVLKLIQNADIIIYNGLHLEGNMLRIFEKLKPYKTIFSIAEGIDSSHYIALSEFADSYDPHIWMDIPLWLSGLEAMTRNLTQLDPKNEKKYQQNFKNYQSKLMDLHLKNIETINQIAPSQRILVTTHDAFSYFSKAYNFPVKALQGISTQSDFGIKKVANLIDFIVTHKIKAIFVESTIPKKAFYNIQEACLQKGHKLQIMGPLYTDSMGIQEANTYYNMLEFNINLISNALK